MGPAVDPVAPGPEHKALALELGANTPGEIASLAVISRPTVGAVTVVSSAHMEFFGSLDGVAEEKSALVRAIPPTGRWCSTPTTPRARHAHAEPGAGALLRHAPRGRRLRGGPAEDDGDGLRFTLAAGTVERPVRLNFAGRHNVVNALAAAGIGLALGLTLEQVARGLEAARPAKGRCVWRRAGALRILDDTYNANPTSVSAALVTLGAATEARGGWRCWATCSSWARSARPRTVTWRAVAASGAAEFVGMGRWASTAVEAARQAGLAESHHVTTFEDTVALLLKRLAPGDAVLVKGSRGMRMERVVDALVARFGGVSG